MNARRTVVVSCLVASVFGLTPPAHAVFDVVFDDGSVQTTDGVVGTATLDFVATGASMAGMGVTMNFTDGTSAPATWAATGPVAGGASGAGWTLTQAGNTFPSSPSAWWVLTNNTAKNIRSVVLDAGAGGHVFDTRRESSLPPDPGPFLDPNFGTLGSADGSDFSVKKITDSSLGFPVLSDRNITATYSNAVALTTQAPVGDLFSTLTIKFNDTNGLPSAWGLWFVADTDKLASPLEPVIPAPGAVLLAAIGLGVVGGRRHAGASRE